MAEWTPLTGFDTSPFESAAQTVDDASTAIATFLQAVAAVLRIIAMFILGDADIITALINAAIDTLEAMILDLLQTNVALAVHLNLNWDPDWVADLSTVPADKRAGTPNWSDDRQWPWSATGIDGWLLDIGASAHNESDPFRPLTDSETMVAGFAYVIGIPSFDNVGNIVKLFEAFTDFSDLGDIIDEGRLERQDDKAILRAKEAMFAKALDKWRINPEENVKSVYEDLMGTLDTGLDGQTNASDPIIFTALDHQFTTTVGAAATSPDNVSILLSDIGVVATVTQVVDNNTLELEYDAAIENYGPGEYKVRNDEGIDAAFRDTLTNWSFKEGVFPKWMSVPLARIFPPIHELLEKLRALANALKMPFANPLADLAELLAYKAELLANLAIEVGDLIQQILALAVLLEGGEFIWIQVGPAEYGDADAGGGGLDSWIGEAIQAEGKPDLGPDAIFGGIVGIVTADNPINHLQTFWDLCGVSVDEYTERATSRAESIEDTVDEITF